MLPKEIEFWLDGEGRIHERLVYIKQNGEWVKKLLYPLEDLFKLKLVKFCKISFSLLSGNIPNAS